MDSLSVAAARALQVFTASKVFDEQGPIGSVRLNRWGLHRMRVALAYALSQRRRAGLAARLSPEDRAVFDRDGVVIQENFLPRASFEALVAQVRSYRTEVKERAEGSTMLRKILVEPQVMQALPALRELVEDARFRALLAYGEGHAVPPAIYLQTVAQKANAGTRADPQCSLHRDTFHPTVKAWLYLTDVPREVGPLRYVRGSHRLTPARLAWESERAHAAAQRRNNEGGSFRIREAELRALGYGAPESLAVPANTLVVADTFGFHARGTSAGPSTRVEVWAIGRRRPFVGFGLDRAIQQLANPRSRIQWQHSEASAYDRYD